MYTFILSAIQITILQIQLFYNTGNTHNGMDIYITSRVQRVTSIPQHKRTGFFLCFRDHYLFLKLSLSIKALVLFIPCYNQAESILSSGVNSMVSNILLHKILDILPSCRKMIMWAIVWSPNWFTNKKSQCLNIIALIQCKAVINSSR